VSANHTLIPLDETISLYAEIAAMRPPDRRPLAAFRDLLEGATFSGKNGTTMITLIKPAEEDCLSRFLQDHWLFRKRNTDDPLDRTTIHKNSYVLRMVAVFGLTIAATLLIGAIVNLYLVPDPKTKLGLVAMYTMLFATSVGLCTNARRAEVFAATAAYAAVLVVFVSGDLGGTKSEQCLIQLEGAIWKTVKCPG
jgi:hypothetical protein